MNSRQYADYLDSIRDADPVRSSGFHVRNPGSFRKYRAPFNPIVPSYYQDPFTVVVVLFANVSLEPRTSLSIENKLDMNLDEIIRREGMEIDPAAIAADESGVDDCYRSFIPVRSRRQEAALIKRMDDDLERYFQRDPRRISENYPELRQVVAEYPF